MHTKYSALESMYDFVTVAVETAGPWAVEAKDFIRDLGQRLRDRGCDPRSGSYLVQQISLAIQRGNAAGVMGTFGPDRVQLLLIQPVVSQWCEVEPYAASVPQKRAPVNAPHHVIVFYERVYCSGSLIASKIVLTVASCFHVRVHVTQIYIKYGSRESLDSSGQSRVLRVVEKKEHEYFRYKSALDNDLALLILENDVVFSDGVAKIPLCNPHTGLPESTVVLVTGRGWKSNRLYDNGGAAVHRGRLVGVSSFGAHRHKTISNGTSQYIALFTNVTYFYRWIELNTERLLAKYCIGEFKPAFKMFDGNYYADTSLLKDVE